MICPDCNRDNDPGRNRCACGALLGTVARRPAPAPDLPPRRGNADVTSYRKFLANPFPTPSRQWARDLIARAEAGERLLRCQIEAATAAVASERVREYRPGEDWEEDGGASE